MRVVSHLLNQNDVNIFEIIETARYFDNSNCISYRISPSSKSNKWTITISVISLTVFDIWVFMGDKKNVWPNLCSPISPDVIASRSIEEFVHYSEDKITCKILVFFWTEHKNKKIFACCFPLRLISRSLLSVVQS